MASIVLVGERRKNFVIVQVGLVLIYAIYLFQFYLRRFFLTTFEFDNGNSISPPKMSQNIEPAFEVNTYRRFVINCNKQGEVSFTYIHSNGTRYFMDKGGKGIHCKYITIIKPNNWVMWNFYGK